jgi:hypothetical protein
MKLSYEFCFSRDERNFHFRLLSYSAPFVTQITNIYKENFSNIGLLPINIATNIAPRWIFTAVKMDSSLSTATLVFRVQWLSIARLAQEAFQIMKSV